MAASHGHAVCSAYPPLLPHSSGTLPLLSPALRRAVLCCAVVSPCCRLCIWRLVRAIQQRPPPVELRRSLGPGFVSSRNPGGDIAYNRNNPPVAPSYLGAEVVAKWSARVPFNVLAGYCKELGLMQVSVVGGGEGGTQREREGERERGRERREGEREGGNEGHTHTHRERQRGGGWECV